MEAVVKNLFQNVDFNKYYSCQSLSSYTMTLNLDPTIEETLNVTMVTRDWQVQAFSFKKNATNGTFDQRKREGVVPSRWQR